MYYSCLVVIAFKLKNKQYLARTYMTFMLHYVLIQQLLVTAPIDCVILLFVSFVHSKHLCYFCFVCSKHLCYFSYDLYDSYLAAMGKFERLILS